MPRGRHRHSPPLHRLLPPSSVAATSIACAAGAWFVGDDLVQRGLAAGAAVAAVTGSVLLRVWDRRAGKRVAELSRARVRDEWRTEERIAELETDVEEAREIRAALDTKLRAKRAELARLRTEHADLLRRYATAETERASALEGRRLLAIEAAAPAKALPAPGSGLPRQPHVPTASGGRHAANGRPATDARATAGASAADGRPAATATFAQADLALQRLARNAARQRGNGGTGQDARGGQGGSRNPAQDRPEQSGGRGGEDGQGKPAAAAARTAAAATPALRHIPAAAAAVAPPAAPRPRASRAIGGFDFFGNAAPRELPAPLEEDLADVVGDEAVAEQSAHATARLRPGQAPDEAAQEARTEEAGDGRTAAAPDGSGDTAEVGDGTGDEAGAGVPAEGVGEVIDLTAHDETEQFDVAELRSAIS
ncbi:hypothetical protein [Streptomyces pinistramenti]|uniref:hypothetical protein n=1 Tax=Streptomyces pinistramenti TaxID=2884812 RepID=UPI001D07A0D0|nr:hypothetical protein [Streptomyces pinistramenti]MCB5911242.1 hypothetical protein [Streptomyces pinistramenti]